MILKNEELVSKIYFPRTILGENIKPGQKILDVGCATGTFLKYCDNYGLKTYGLDINAVWVKKAKNITKAKLLVHNLNNDKLPFLSNFFDVITAFDVIEHLDSPYSFLQDCRRILKPKGKIVITTPNLDSLGRMIMGSRWHGYSDKTHKYLFTLQSLNFSLMSTGFKTIRGTTPFHPLPFILQKLLNKTGLGGQIWIVAKK